MITCPVSAARWIALDTSEHYVTVTLAAGSQARWVAAAQNRLYRLLERRGWRLHDLKATVPLYLSDAKVYLMSNRSVRYSLPC